MAEEESVEVPTKDAVRDMMSELGDEVTLPLGVELDDGGANDDDKARQISGDDKPPTDDSGTEDPPKETNTEDESELSALSESEEVINELVGGEEEPEEEEEENEEFLKNADEATQNAFKSMREKIKDYQQRLESSDDSDKVKALESQLSALQTRLGAVDLAASPQFRQKHDVPIAREIQTLRKVLADAGSNDEVLKKALGFNNIVDRKKFLLEEVPVLANELSLMFTKVDSMRIQRASALKDFMSTKRNMAVEDATTRGELVNEAFTKAVNVAREANNFLLREIEGKQADSWNGNVQKRISNAKKLAVSIDGNTELLAETAVKATVSDEYRNLYLAERQARQKLEVELGRRKKSSPKLRVDGSGKPVTKKNDSSDMSLDDMADNIMGRDYGAGAIN